MLETLIIGLTIGVAVAIMLILVRSARTVVMPVLLFLGVAALSLVVNLREEQRKDYQAEARNAAPDRQSERTRGYITNAASSPASEPSTVMADGRQIQPQPQPPRPNFGPQPLPPHGAAAGVNANQTSYVNPGLR